MINREASSSSRFHIIKIETGPYRRGRWNCRDFDELASSSSSAMARSDMIVVGPRSGSSSESSGRPSFHIITEENGPLSGDHPLIMPAEHAVPHHPIPQVASITSRPPLPNRTSNSPHTSTLTQGQHKPVTHTDSYSGSPAARISAISGVPSKAIITTHVTPASQQPPISAPPTSTSLPNIAQHQSHHRSQSPVAIPSTTAAVAPASTTAGRFQVRPVDLNNAAAAILDSIVGSMQNDNHRIVLGAGGRQPGSVISFQPAGSSSAAAAAAAQDGAVGGNGNAGMGHATGAVMLAQGSAGCNVVAIDNKIEQAMDLVKTHLLYAVREEVEVLKEKIIDLEKKVFRLETENKLLREYAPPDILSQIQQPQSSAAGGPSLSSQSNLVPSSSATPAPQKISHAATSQSLAGPKHQPVQGTGAAASSAPVPSTAVSTALPSVIVHHQPHQ